MSIKWHKFIFCFCLCLLISLISFPCFSQEQLTITTYYPAPYGVYLRMRLAPSAITIGTNCGAPPGSNDGEGAMAYSSSEESLMVCTTNGASPSLTWQLAPGYKTKYWVPDTTGGIRTATGFGQVGINRDSAAGWGLAIAGQTYIGGGNLYVGWDSDRRKILVNNPPGGGSGYDIDARGIIHAHGSDLAETIPVVVEGSLAAGDVVVIDATTGRVRKTSQEYDAKVAGVVSTEPGMQLGEPNNDKNASLSLAGQVPCKATASNGPITPGDLLTTSSKPGYTMKATFLSYDSAESIADIKKISQENDKRKLAIIGRALEPLAEGDGVIKILVE